MNRMKTCKALKYLAAGAMLVWMLVIAGCSSGKQSLDKPQIYAEARNQCVLLTWAPVKNAKGYKISYGTEPGKYTETKKVGAVSGCTVTGLKNSTDYYFSVTAIAGPDYSAPSEEMSVTPVKGVEPELTADSAQKSGKIVHGTIWVSTNGDDISNDGSKKQPLRTIAYALSKALPGDTVIIQKGSYYEFNIGQLAGGKDNKGGADGKWITLKSETKHGAVIDGLENGEVIRFAGAHYIAFDGFEIKNSGSNLIHADGNSSHLIFKNIKAHHAGPDGDVMKFNQSDNITVENCDVSYPGGRTGSDSAAEYQELIDFVDVDNAIVRNCILHHAGNLALYSKGGSHDSLFENNVILGNNLMENTPDGLIGIGAWTDRGLFVDGAVYESYDTIIRNNIIIAPRREAISIYDSTGGKIYNNTIINPGSHFIHFRKGNAPKDESRNFEIFNNIFADTRGEMSIPFAKQPERAVFNIKHGSNLFWNGGKPIPERDANYNVSVADPLKGKGSFTADPLFKNPRVDLEKLSGMSYNEIARQFKPSGKSPAAGKGITSKLVAKDFFGKKRPDKPGIGAILTK